MATRKRAIGKHRSDGELKGTAARKALDQATSTIKKLQRDAERNAWKIGARLLQVAEFGLHKSRGFERLEDYAERVLGISSYTAFQDMRIAGAFSEEVAAAFGAEKLDRALAYIAATPEAETAADIPELRVRVPGHDGESPTTVPFARITIAELRRSTQAEKARAGRGKKALLGLGERDAARLVRANKDLDRAVGSQAAKEAALSVRKAPHAGIVVDARGVPLDRAGKAFAALARVFR